MTDINDLELLTDEEWGRLSEGLDALRDKGSCRSISEKRYYKKRFFEDSNILQRVLDMNNYIRTTRMREEPE